MSASIFGVGNVQNVNVAGSFQQLPFTATAGQTLFTITGWTYTPGTGSLLVFINGQKQYLGRDFVETSSSSFTLLEGCEVGDYVDVIGLPAVTLTALTVPSSAWNGSHLVMGAYHFWVDSSNRLRIKSSTPTSDTDGTIVGTQS